MLDLNLIKKLDLSNMRNIGFEFHEKKKKKFSYNIKNIYNIQMYPILKSTQSVVKNNRTISIYPFSTATINAGILLNIMI